MFQVRNGVKKLFGATRVGWQTFSAAKPRHWSAWANTLAKFGAAGTACGLATMTAAVSYAESNKSKIYMPTNDEAYDFRIFSGNGNPVLANEIALLLGCQLGRATIGKYKDGETRIRFYDSVRGKHVYVIQPTSFPPNDNLMELLLMISTLRRASAQKITAILPYYGYSRQLSPIGKDGEGMSLAAADVAVMLKTVGVDQVVSVDLHRDQITGFFENGIVVENLDTTKPMLPYLLNQGLQNPVCVSVGRVKKVKYLRDQLSKAGLESDMGFLFYQGQGGFQNVNDDTHPDEKDKHEVLSHRLEFVGDVKDRDVLILTDIVETGSRVTSAANHLRDLGANRIFALTTHGLLSENSVEAIDKSALDEIILFNTIPQTDGKDSPKIRTLTIAPLIAETISRMQNRGSVKELY
eukprot:CAMPEP_0184489108 /NCGR_PEP_ID=MMETSP0113_2-20130426/14415_1 /TAXON_ID=91329 /ORGANISM="Norrisiella sphaerica, Strain BC52" /LENGTH=408 /DNA_ID=CAMNT_0026872337 /DNA_START=181 /DNA_END=1407 /DNA_ORIENTATION=+